MPAHIIKRGTISTDNAADGLEEREKMAHVVNSNAVGMDLQQCVNGKPLKVKNVTWGTNMVKEYHDACNDTHLQDDVDMRFEDPEDVLEVQEDASPTKTKKLVRKGKEMSKSCERNKKQEA
jgi:mevalonate kinase